MDRYLIKAKPAPTAAPAPPSAGDHDAAAGGTQVSAQGPDVVMGDVSTAAASSKPSHVAGSAVTSPGAGQVKQPSVPTQGTDRTIGQVAGPPSSSPGPASVPAPASAPAPAPAVSLAEQRKRNVARNREVLKELGVRQQAAEIKRKQQELDKARAAAAAAAALKSSATKRRRRAAGGSDSPVVLLPRRASKRIRGVSATGGGGGAYGDGARGTGAADAAAEDDPFDHLVDAMEFWKARGVTPQIVSTDSHYRGWVNPELISKYGLEASAKDAWEANGGGRFTFGNGKGKGKRKGKGKSSTPGWSDAKAMAKAMFAKNPNQYFYRLTAPDHQQSMGDWTPEEHDTFLRVAKQYGCGDKWGLFATWIPNRVGYQCSA